MEYNVTSSCAHQTSDYVEELIEYFLLQGRRKTY